jgi:hypothetical protein
MPNHNGLIIGIRPSADPTIASTSAAIPAASRAVSARPLTISPMLTLAATMTRPARAAVAPAIATLNSAQSSRPSIMVGMLSRPRLSVRRARTTSASPLRI